MLLKVENGQTQTDGYKFEAWPFWKYTLTEVWPLLKIGEMVKHRHTGIRPKCDPFENIL